MYFIIFSKKINILFILFKIIKYRESDKIFAIVLKLKINSTIKTVSRIYVNKAVVRTRRFMTREDLMWEGN